eukprot:282781_1
MGKRNMLQIHGNDGYQLDCKTEWGPYVSKSQSNGKSSASCDSGYTIWGCSGYFTRWSQRDTLAGYYREWNGACIAQSVSTDSLRAIATCCRLYKEPTSAPTSGPTSLTIGPTSLTTGPSTDPTTGPTGSPSTNPTAPPSTSPTISPTIAPTNAQSSAPSSETSNAPS